MADNLGGTGVGGGQTENTDVNALGGTGVGGGQTENTDVNALGGEQSTMSYAQLQSALGSGYSYNEVQSYANSNGIQIPGQPSINDIVSGNVQALTQSTATAMDTVANAQLQNTGSIPIPGGMSEPGGSPTDAGNEAATGAPPGSLPGTINQSLTQPGGPTGQTITDPVTGQQMPLWNQPQGTGNNQYSIESAEVQEESVKAQAIQSQNLTVLPP
jgi:hypothetical protein